MDRAQEQEMVFNCDRAAVILAVGRDFRLVVLDSTPIPDLTAEEWKDARFVGCLAFANGRVNISLDEELTPEDMRVLCAAFLELVSAKPNSGDGWADYMRRLWTLPDTRENRV